MVEPTPASPETADAASPDDALLVAIQQRDEAALAALYDRYGRLAYALAYRILGERGAAEDVVQEAFLNVWRRAASFQAGRAGARPWLLSIVHNLAIDRRRGRFRHQLQDQPLDGVEFALPCHDDA
jgi:RNA polymerase sigma-70 factor (ECF subfamily)